MPIYGYFIILLNSVQFLMKSEYQSNGRAAWKQSKSENSSRFSLQRDLFQKSFNCTIKW